jgi:hypothetical protein
MNTDLGRYIGAVQIVADGWYFALRIEAKCESGLEEMRQAVEMSMLLLTHSMFLIPRPPSFFGVHISFHERRCSGFVAECFWTPCHQKVRMIVVILARNFFMKRMFAI